MKNFWAILLIYEAMLGLKVNLRKGKLTGMGDVGSLPSLASIMDCQIASFLITYLRLPLGAKYKAKVNWSPDVEKMKRRLPTWKGRYLSKRGKLTLLKSVISSLPLYFLSLYSTPALVLGRLKRIHINFLWASHEGDNKFHLMRWDCALSNGRC